MATLVNRYIIARIEGEEVKCRVLSQNPGLYWIKVMHPEGYEYMLSSDQFVRVAGESDR
jgi:hypothetical protein